MKRFEISLPEDEATRALSIIEEALRAAGIDAVVEETPQSSRARGVPGLAGWLGAMATQVDDMRAHLLFEDEFEVVPTIDNLTFAPHAMLAAVGALQQAAAHLMLASRLAARELAGNL